MILDSSRQAMAMVLASPDLTILTRLCLILIPIRPLEAKLGRRLSRLPSSIRNRTVVLHSSALEFSTPARAREDLQIDFRGRQATVKALLIKPCAAFQVCSANSSVRETVSSQTSKVMTPLDYNDELLSRPRLPGPSRRRKRGLECGSAAHPAVRGADRRRMRTTGVVLRRVLSVGSAIDLPLGIRVTSRLVMDDDPRSNQPFRCSSSAVWLTLLMLTLYVDGSVCHAEKLPTTSFPLRRNFLFTLLDPHYHFLAQ
jgi:hypothetical protein